MEDAVTQQIETSPAINQSLDQRSFVICPFAYAWHHGVVSAARTSAPSITVFGIVTGSSYFLCHSGVRQGSCNRSALSREAERGRRRGMPAPGSGCSGRLLPCPCGFHSEEAKGGTGEQMALKVEGVLNRGLHAEKALG